MVTWRDGVNAAASFSRKPLARHTPRAFASHTRRSFLGRHDRDKTSASRNIGHDLPLVKKSQARSEPHKRYRRHDRNRVGRVATIIRAVPQPRASHGSRYPVRGALPGPVSSGRRGILCRRSPTVKSDFDPFALRDRFGLLLGQDDRVPGQVATENGGRLAGANRLYGLFDFRRKGRDRIMFR